MTTHNQTDGCNKNAEILAGLEGEDERNAFLESLIRPLPRAKYEVDYRFADIENGLRFLGEAGSLDLTPDFQRGHVWTQAQQERWVEAVIRGAIASSGRIIQFNCPNWSRDQQKEGDLADDEVVCIDGLQRLTAARRFVAGEIRAFGLTCKDLDGTPFSIRRMNLRLTFAVHEFQTRSDLLQYYLDINAGGTPHPNSELERVQGLLKAARAQTARSKSPKMGV